MHIFDMHSGCQIVFLACPIQHYYKTTGIPHFTWIDCGLIVKCHQVGKVTSQSY